MKKSHAMLMAKDGVLEIFFNKITTLYNNYLQK